MIFGTTGKGWTALDCADGGTWCAVSVRNGPPGSRARVLAAAEVADPGPDGQPQALRDLMAGVARRLPVLVTLGHGDYQLRVMPQPAVPARDVAENLRWTIASESDSPLDEMNIAWLPIPALGDEPARQNQLYAITTPSARLNEQLASWREGGVKPKVVDIRETALRNIAGALEQPGEGLALVAVGASGVSIVFTHQGSLFLDRHIELPTGSLAEAGDDARERLYERVADQLQRSVDVIDRTLPFMPVSRIVVAASAQAPGLLDALASRLPLSVQPLDLGQVFDLDAVPELAQSADMQARCLVALGATLRGARAPA